MERQKVKQDSENNRRKWGVGGGE